MKAYQTMQYNQNKILSHSQSKGEYCLAASWKRHDLAESPPFYLHRGLRWHLSVTKDLC